MYTSDILDDSALGGAEYTPRFANFGPRLGAALLDFICVLPIIGASTYFTIFAPSLMGVLAVGVLSMLYKPGFEKIYGATPGKMMLKLKVVAKEGEPITWGQAIMRYTPWLIGAVFSLYVTSLVFQIPGLEDVDGFMEYSQLIAEYQAEGGMSSTLSVLQSLLGFLPLVSALFMLGNARRQAAHDTLAETYVIHTQAKVV